MTPLHQLKINFACIRAGLCWVHLFPWKSGQTRSRMGAHFYQTSRMIEGTEIKGFDPDPSSIQQKKSHFQVPDHWIRYSAPCTNTGHYCSFIWCPLKDIQGSCCSKPANRVWTTDGLGADSVQDCTCSQHSKPLESPPQHQKDATCSWWTAEAASSLPLSPSVDLGKRPDANL